MTLSNSSPIHYRNPLLYNPASSADIPPASLLLLLILLFSSSLSSHILYMATTTPSSNPIPPLLLPLIRQPLPRLPQPSRAKVEGVPFGSASGGCCGWGEEGGESLYIIYPPVLDLDCDGIGSAEADRGGTVDEQGPKRIGRDVGLVRGYRGSMPLISEADIMQLNSSPRTFRLCTHGNRSSSIPLPPFPFLPLHRPPNPTSAMVNTDTSPRRRSSPSRWII